MLLSGNTPAIKGAFQLATLGSQIIAQAPRSLLCC
jgi:hypothetical protein